MTTLKLKRIVLLLVACGVIALAAQRGNAQSWVKVGEGINSCGNDGMLCGISGMALMSKAGETVKFLVVHDSKGKNDLRLGILTPSAKPNLKLLNGFENINTDLEAITSLPDKSNEFLAMSSDGRLFHVTLNAESADVKQKYKFFEDKDNLVRQEELEGLSVQKFGDTIVIIWGDRGEGMPTGKLYWGTLDYATWKVTKVGEMTISGPFPDVNSSERHTISDLKLDKNGLVWSTAAHDPSVKGPFFSSVYLLGHITVNNKVVSYELFKDRPPLWTFKRKIEAIEFVPDASGGIAFGAEDENLGGWIYF